MYSDSSNPPGRIGIVIYDPEAPEHVQGQPLDDDAVDYRWRHASAVVDRETLEAFTPRKQYITQLETLAAVLAYTSRPSQFRGRDVIHFIDNSGALAIIAHGYSKDLDCGRLSHFYHSIAAAIQTTVWFEYVPSAANISDLPSRGEFEKLGELGSVSFEIVWPELGASWSASFAAAYNLYAPKPGKAALRLRRAIDQAILKLEGLRV